MDFRRYLEKTWDSDEFCNILALKARGNAITFVEMALGAQNISKMPVFHDADTWRFLQQFPPEAWTNALHWLYNTAIVGIMKQPRQYGEIPEGMNWTGRVEFPDPNNGKKKTWVFETPGEKGIYVGLTDLVHKLTKPAKTRKDQTAENLPPAARRYWAGNEGPALKDIDPNQKDPNHPAHISKYKHGMYDLDLEDLAEATPEDIDNKPDWEIQQLLPEKYRELPLDNEEVKQKIVKKREAMKQVLKTTFAGYDVLQPDVAGRSITNWIRANGLPERPFGEHPSTIQDPNNPNKTYEVRDLNRGEIEGINKKWELTHGHEKGNKQHVDVPAIEKTFNYKVKDNKTGKEENKTKTTWVPVLNPVKALPVVSLSQEQQQELEKRRNLKNPEKGASVKGLNNLQGMLNNWDLLTDTQKDYVTQHAKTPFEVARSTHTKLVDPNADVDERARAHAIYAAGFRPNYKAGQTPHLSLPPEKADEFIKKYKGEIAGEVFTTVDRILTSYEKGKTKNAQVVKALRAADADPDKPGVSEVITYYVLTWLDNPAFGIKDPDLGLLKNVPPDEYDAEDNKERRQTLVWKEIQKIIQIGFASVPSRRIRERYGIPGEQSADAAAGESGTSMAGNIAQGAKGTQKEIPDDPVRAALLSEPGAIARGGQKPHKMFNKLSIWLATNRNKILNKIPSKQAESDLSNADKNVLIALEVSETLYQKFNAELSKTITDPDKLDEEVQKKVDAYLPTELKKRLQGLPSSELEKAMTQAKNINYSAIPKSELMQIEKESQEAFEKFFNDLSTKEVGRKLMFDPSTNRFIETTQLMHLKDFSPNQPGSVVDYINGVIPIEFWKMKNYLLKNAGWNLYNAIEAYYDVDKPEDELKKEYMAALAKLPQFSTSQQSPAQPQQTPAPMPQAPVSFAAKSLPELLDVNVAGKFRTPEEMTQIGNAILAKQNELMVMPGGAAKLKAAIDAMQATRKDLVQHAGTKEEYLMLRDIKNLYMRLKSMGS